MPRPIRSTLRETFAAAVLLALAAALLDLRALAVIAAALVLGVAAFRASKVLRQRREARGTGTASHLPPA